ncbi:MAG: hypothetical protein J6V44_18010 [Methanobrevibacter sp.]|nr:hypothetical protein [Methanobrevibacter sp.]
MAEFTRIGYGQVEPNQLSGIKTGQIFASLPLDPEVNVLQNGEFMYYDYASGKVSATDSTGVAEPMLVFQEIKIYEDWLSYKDFAMIRVGDNYVTNRPAVGNLTSANVDGTIYGDGALTTGVNPNPSHTEYGYRMDGIAPRLIKTNLGDVFTTNMVALGVEYAQGDILSLAKTDRNTLELSKEGTGNMKFVVAKVYTMPDGQPGLKVQRVQ